MRLVRRTLAVAVTALAALSAAACASPAPDPGPTTSAPVASGTGTPTPTPAATAARPITSVAALGDSLSLGFDACSHYGPCTTASWVTGTDRTVASIASRLASAQGGRRPTVYDDATPGAAVRDLDGQVSLAIAQRPDLVTVLIGANDVCVHDISGMTSAAEYAAAADGALRRLSDALPGSRILVASVPDVTNLLPVASRNETARFLWGLVGGCRTALAVPLSTAPPAIARRVAVRSRIAEYNLALAASCGRLPSCSYDGGALHAYQPTIAQLSPLDYFHPSVAGLRELAATEWRVLQAARRG